MYDQSAFSTTCPGNAFWILSKSSMCTAQATGSYTSFLQFPPRVSRLNRFKERRLLAVAWTRYLFLSRDVLQVVPVLENLDLWMEGLENGLLRHQANAVREVLDFDAILSGPICFFPLNESLCNKDPLPRFVCCKQRAALPEILEA